MMRLVGALCAVDLSLDDANAFEVKEFSCSTYKVYVYGILR